MAPDLAQATRIDVAFALGAGALTQDYRAPLLLALRPLLPWLETEAGAGIVGVRMTPTEGGTGLLSRRARLTLRVPLARVEEAAALQGRALEIAGTALTLGAVHLRPLQVFPTLYAEFVHLGGEQEEAHFARELEAALVRAASAPCRFILGRRRAITAEGRVLHGFAVALHDCGAAVSLRLQESGVGSARALGGGIFVPHKKISFD